jgi:PIN domain nuclease of toxin-antitoxin system
LSLLLDTHAFIWWRSGNPALGIGARAAIAAAERVAVSAASAWEAAIKISQGKLKLPERFADGVARSGFVPMPVAFVHAEQVALLPWHHRDPFDRMLVAQAKVEGLTIVTADRIFSAYGIPVVAA